MMEQMKEKMMCRLSPQYDTSFQNPDQAEAKYPDQGAWYAVIQAEVSGIYEDMSLGRKSLQKAKECLLLKTEEVLEAGCSKENRKQLKNLWKEYLYETAVMRAEEEVRSLILTGNENPYEKILEKATPENVAWMEAYGLPITEIERQMMLFWFGLPEEKLTSMGETIAEAFLHGFISQSRDRRNRRRVRFFYQVGQEALAQKVMQALKKRGLTPVITVPHTLYALNQWKVDHQYDRILLMDKELWQVEWDAYKVAMQHYEPELKDTCGMIGIDQFGAEPEIYTPCSAALLPDKEMRTFGMELERKKREMEAKWVKPSEISFCKVAFPNNLTGEKFEDIFRDFFEMNVEHSEPFELQQQVLIDGLDTCEAVQIMGCNGNETDIRINLGNIEVLEKETKFLNCGGDLNIPYGEVFTTPVLAGTNGIYHVEEICLKGVFYHDLRLTFKDGWIVDANCKEGREYVQSRLLDSHESLPIGEFAVGTNTKAYAVAEKYQLGGKLPILIYEKMGPHIAIGDPCFARSEDAPIYNMYDQKEMVCRENEVTKDRNVKENVYFGLHIDITLPYHQVQYLRGTRKDGTIVSFIENGRFVLEGTEGLNIGLGGK